MPPVTPWAQPTYGKGRGHEGRGAPQGVGHRAAGRRQADGDLRHAVQTGNLLFLAGKGPFNPDGSTPTGKVGRDVTTEEAYQHARSVGLMLIAVMKDVLGDL